MKYQRIQIFLFIFQNIVFSDTINAPVPNLKHFLSRSIRNSLQNSDNIFDEHAVGNMSASTRHGNTEKSWTLNSFTEKSGNFSDADHPEKRHFTIGLITKSPLSPNQSQDSQIGVNVTNSENLDIVKITLNDSTVPTLNFPANFTPPTKVYKSSAVVVDKNGTATRRVIKKSSSKKNWFFIDLSPKSSTNRYNETNTDLSMKGNDSNSFTTKSLENQTLLSPESVLVDNWYTSPIAVIDLRGIFNGCHDSNCNSTNISLSSACNVSDTIYNLTENVLCVVKKEFINISCRNVSLYSIGEYLPNETSVLDLSYSYQIKLLKPLFPHLKELKSLTLSNNHHRYITKAFMGLENLEVLDLRNNDIIALLKAFTYIPRLKVLNLANNLLRRVSVVSNAVSHLRNLQNLTLDHNVYINHVSKDHLYGLRNCNISLFSLFNTTLRNVEKGAFSFLPNLVILEMSVNYLNEIALSNITCSLAKSVEILYFGQMLNIKTFPVEAIECLTSTKVRELRLWYNYFITMPVLPNLPYLQLLSVSNCSLNVIESDAFENVTNLEVLDFSGNKFEFFPSAISSAKNLKRLDLDSQNGYSYDSFKLQTYAFQNFTHLQELKLSHTHMDILLRRHLYGLGNLKILSLSLTQLVSIADYSFETLGSLEILDLRGNGIKEVSNFTFFGLKNLRQLYLSGNFIEFISSVYPFRFSPLISVILLHTNQITTIPKAMFADLESLEFLTLGRNKLLPWSEGILHPDARLQILDLSRNNIDYISQVMLEEFHQVTDHLDVSKNPFNCSKCGMKEFQSFCHSSNLSFKLPIPRADQFYICMNPASYQNENFFDLELPHELCDLESRVLSVLIIILMCSFILTIILASSLCYTFRWYVRYWIFHCKTNARTKNSSFRQKFYRYDAFIIYSSADTSWVVRHLIPTLENQAPHYNLCIHQRDFQVGRQITENILEAIENSRKVILILTESFIKSEWCMYELHLAQHKLFRDTRDILILVKLRAINKKLYTKNISYIEKTRRCFMWTDNHIGQKLFWEQILKQLGLPGTGKNNQVSSHL